MATLKIYGASDDLVETEGIEGADEFGAYSSDKLVGKLVVSALGEDVLEVFCIYNGTWAFAVTPAWNALKEEYPDWCEIRREWGADIDYSETVYIDVPDSASVRFERA